MSRSRLRVVLFTFWVAGAVAGPAWGAVERYKTEAGYLARLAQLGLDTVTEGFESSVWDGTHSPMVFNPNILPSVLSQNILWEPAAKDVWGSQFSTKQHGLSTNGNWARSGSWGVFENHLGESYPTTIRVSSAAPIFAVGGWFNTNPDGQSVGFLFEDRTTANTPGYVLPGFGTMYPGDNPAFGHAFVGIVDPAGISSVVLTGTLQVNESGVLEGGTAFGADDFTFGVPQGFAGIAGDYDNSGQVEQGDLDLVLLNWGSDGTTPPSGWLNDLPSGLIDQQELDGVLLNWGNTSEPRNTPVPEPAGALGLLLLGGAATGRRRRAVLRCV